MAAPARLPAVIHVGFRYGASRAFMAWIWTTVQVARRNSCWRGARAAESDSLLTRCKQSTPF
jgi:hypothetical protein